MSAADARRLRECIAGGGVAVFPADTVYGLACDPLNREAVRRLYELKGRPPERPAAVMFFSLAPALEALPELGGRERAALRALLPGPLTLLLPNREDRYPLACRPASLRPGAGGAPDVAEDPRAAAGTESSQGAVATERPRGDVAKDLRSAAGTESSRGAVATERPRGDVAKGSRSGKGALGLRVPLLPERLAALRAVDLPVMQSSANLSGGPEARRLADVPPELLAGADLVLDGGQLPGIASTVLDLREYEANGRWRIVREGPVGPADVRWALGR